MPHTTACTHCGFTVRFEEEDRGFEVYCDSCGRSNLIPAASEAAASETAASETAASEAAESETDRSTVSVFTAGGTAQAEQQVVADEVCLCGTKIPVRVEDYGGMVYCPSCAAEIQVGSTLADGKYRVARQAEGQDEQPKSVPVSKPRLRLVRSPLGVTALLVVAVSAAAGGYYTWRHPQAVVDAVRVILPSSQPKAAKVPPRQDPSEGQPPPVSIVPDPPITMDLIEALLKGPDFAEALVQAQIWQETLRAQGAAQDDPRLLKLAQVIETLMEKLAPKPSGPPAELTEFRRLVQAIADALKATNLPAARKALNRAEAFLKKHQDALAPYCQRMLLLKARLQSQEAAVAGVRGIEKMLDAARRDLAAGKVTEALESEARAKFAALSTPLTDAEFKGLDEKERGLIPQIQLACGKRAVDDAHRCHQAGDRQARNRQVRRAFSLLPGLPESQVNPLLERVQLWAEEAGKSRAAAEPKTEIARSIQRRDRYEALLKHYGDADCAKLSEACREYAGLLGDDEQSQQQHRQVEDMLFDVLEREIAGRLQTLAPPEQKEKFSEQLSQIRRILDRADWCQQSHRWKALDGAIRQQGNRLAQTALDEARAMAEEDNLKEAIGRIAEAERTGPTETARRARQLREKWQAELDYRADQAAQRQSWQRIQSLLAKPNQELLVWKELQLFSKRFPDSPRSQEIARLKTQTKRAIEAKIAQRIQYARDQLEKQQWARARTAVELLQAAPIPPSQRPLLDEMVKRLDELEQRAENELALLGYHKKLFTEENCLAVLRALPRILAMDPNNKQAQALLERARRQAAVRARKLINSAIQFKIDRPSVYKALLERAIRLDPNGQYGKKAGDLLKRR